MASQGQVRLFVAQDPFISRMYTDPKLFRQILYNYLSNAIKFTPPGGAVSVGIRREPQGFVRLEVSDTGPGIDSRDMPKLFTAFEQLDGADRSSIRGTGLGLALVKRFATLQNGHVGVESVLGKGSTFFVILPLTESDLTEC